MNYSTQADRSAIRPAHSNIKTTHRHNKNTGWSNRPLNQKIALASGIAAFALVLVIFLSQIVVSANPYDEASQQVNYLLESQPDLASRLDYAASTRVTLQPITQPGLAQEIAGNNLYEIQQEWIVLLESSDVSAADIAALTGLMDGLAQEIIALETSVQTNTGIDKLAGLLNLFSSDPQAVSSIILKEIHTESPLLIDQINSHRANLQSISNSARLIQNTPALLHVIEALKNTSTNQRTVLVYLQAYESWSQLPAACESLEIQFASTVSILEGITQALDQASNQDRRVGFSIWEPIALWVTQQRWLVALGSVTFFLLSMLPAFLKAKASASYYPTSNTKTPKAQPAPVRTTQSAKSTNQSKQRLFENNTPWLVNTLVPTKAAGQAPTKPNISKRHNHQVQPRLMVLWPDGRRELKDLNGDKSFRIGSDSRYAIPIQRKEGGYIDVWIRGAQVGHFVEVMFSDVPVLINKKPFDGARMLRHGDMIQVLELMLVYLEY